MTTEYVGSTIDEQASRRGGSNMSMLPPTKSIGVRVAGGLLAIWKAMTINSRVAIGSFIVVIFVLVGVFGPLFITIDPMKTSSAFMAKPSAQHLLGTTEVGEDLFSQLIYGTRYSVFWGLLTAFLVTIVSTAVGLVGGYIGGWVDDVLTFVTNVSLVLPALPLAIVLAAYFPRGPLTICLVIVVTNWAWGARVLRSQTLSMRSRDFVTAARASGEGTWRILVYELLPNQIGLIVAGFVSTTIFVILAWAGLEFLGLGDNKVPSWGGILYSAQQGSALIGGQWWWFVPPGLCIAVLGAGLALINFGIDEVADPRLRNERMPKVIRRALQEKKVVA